MTVHLTRDAWLKEATDRYGENSLSWRFRCPVCKHDTMVEDWQNAKAPEGAVAFSCVGRYLPEHNEAFRKDQKGPCNYAGGGLFRLNPIHVTDDGEGKVHQVFDFSERPLAPEPSS